MKSLFSWFLLIVICICSMFIVGCDTVPPGEVGVVVNKFGTDKGVSGLALKTGAVFYNPFTQKVVKFPTFMQNRVYCQSPNEGAKHDQSITFNSIEGAGINVDIAIGVQFDPLKVPALYVEFRQPAETIIDVYVHSQVRDTFNRHASKMKVTDIFGAKKQDLLVDVKKDLADHLGPKGFIFDMISFTTKLRVDAQVEQSINAVIQAGQKAVEAQNKIVQATAEAAQKVATAEGEAKSITAVATAQANANILLAKSLTPELVQYMFAKGWDGKAPMVMGGATPLLQLPIAK